MSGKGCKKCAVKQTGKLKRLTTEEFIKRSKKVHGENRYDYSDVVYKNNTTKVKIHCNRCGANFEQIPANHLNGMGCLACAAKERGENRSISRKSFIERANKIHNNKYDYSMVEENISYHSKVRIICPEHGPFLQTVGNHLSGKKCRKCAGGEPLNTKSFIKKAIKKHGNIYDYSKVRYVDSKTKVCIVCKKHGEFWQSPASHLQGSKCPECSGCKKITNESFKIKAMAIHGNKYDYSKVNCDGVFKKVRIICPIHGEFTQSVHAHLRGQGCPLCQSSKGETTITKLLTENRISFQSQKTFIGCEDKRLLPFDFYLPEYNLAVEFDGIQHYEVVNHFGTESFKKTQEHDKIKTNYCYDNDIILCRIKYNQDIYKELSKYIELKESA